MQQDEQHNARWFGLASIWLGGLVSIPSLLIGSTLISGLNFTSTLIAGLLGLAFVTIFMCLESVAATEQRLNLVQLAKSAFGNKGSTILIGAIVGLATIGWFGVQTNIAGASFSKIVNDTFGISLPDTVSSVFWGIVMLVTAVYGFTLMKWLNYIAVPAIVLLMIYGLSISFDGIGWKDIFAFQPEQPMNILSAIGLTIGFISVGGVISPDINQFAKTRKDAIPPIAGVIISDYWLAKSFNKNTERIINWFGIGAWLIGVLTMVLMQGAVKNLLSIFIAAIAYWLFHLIFKKSK